MRRIALTVALVASLAATPVSLAGAAEPAGGANNVVMATTSSPD